MLEAQELKYKEEDEGGNGSNERGEEGMVVCVRVWVFLRSKMNCHPEDWSGLGMDFSADVI